MHFSCRLSHTWVMSSARKESKVRAIVDAPEPMNVGELRSFLGMVNYYGKFLPDLATTLAPLYRLLRKSCRWRWSTEQKLSFNQVKDLLRSGRVLTHFYDRLPLVLECDASPYGLGAVLPHRMRNGEERPVGYASRTLTKAEINYSHLDKEGLAIIIGVKKFHQYIQGRRFEIRTDHKPLTHIFSESRATPTMASGRIQRWALILGGYDYAIQYKEGKNMANADALSRLPLKTPEMEVPRPPELVHLVEYLDSTPLTSSKIRVWTVHDPILSKVMKWVQEGWPARARTESDLQPYFQRRDELSTEGGCLLWGSRVVIPPRGRERALKLLHEAHPRIARMKALARGFMWWPGMDKATECCVKEAPDRQKRAHDSHSADRQFRLNNTVYVRNYGVGQRWVPGCVVGLLGSAMYRIRLDNNNVVIRHIDQLRHRVATTDTSDSSDSFADPETGNTTETVGPESTELTQYPPGVSETPLTQATPLSAASESEEQTETSSEETDGVPTPETDLADQPEGGGATPALRRSTRVSRPPVRLEETVTFI